MKINPILWRHYKEVYFFINSQLTYKKFAIITAWNPASLRGSNEDNIRNNRSLERDLKDFTYCKISVGDLKRAWLEESFAVETPQNLAIELGKKYNQNAIYYVDNNSLYLISCLENNTLEKIGYRFLERVISKH